MLKAKKIVLPTFTLTEVCEEHDEGAVRRTIENKDGECVVYYFRPTQRPFEYEATGPTYQYNVMPVVTNSTGAPWHEANLYILSKLEHVFVPKMPTYHSIADDLTAFEFFLETEEVDYKTFPRRKLQRPTYRYNGYLTQLAMAGKVAFHTARRRMGTVVGFYRWLNEVDLLRAENALWVQGDAYISYKDEKGIPHVKKVKTTDVSLKVPIQDDPYAGTIDDGEKLRPLPINEQEILLDALINLGNTEMTLIHLLALFTGARIQTILTLQVRHFEKELADNLGELQLPVGGATGIDSKFNKKMTVHIPRWLYEKIRTYIFSERAKRRRNKAGGGFENQYLFISSHGLPFYTSKTDASSTRNKAPLRHEKRGQGIRQYIHDYILPLMRIKLGSKYKYKFHDLRASFGMNLTDSLLPQVPEKYSLHQVREFVKTRMGHEHVSQTDRYLNFRTNEKLASDGQLAWEGNLKKLEERAMGLNI